MTIKTKRRICASGGAAALLLMIIFVGGMERGWMPLGWGAALAALCEVLGAALLWKGGVIQWP